MLELTNHSEARTAEAQGLKFSEGEGREAKKKKFQSFHA